MFTLLEQFALRHIQRPATRQRKLTRCRRLIYVYLTRDAVFFNLHLRLYLQFHLVQAPLAAVARQVILVKLIGCGDLLVLVVLLPVSARILVHLEHGVA